MTIRKATHQDVEALCRHLARAFDDDPILNWLVRQDGRRVRGLQTLFRTTLVKLSLRHGEVRTTDDCVGGAIWYPPGTATIGVLRQLSMLPQMIRGVGLRGVGRLVGFMSALEKIHPSADHFYLEFLGVDPDHQGKGRGGALMRPVLQHCDREGLGAYLENTKESNLSFYQKHGFVASEPLRYKASPPIWPMWRDSIPAEDD